VLKPCEVCVTATCPACDWRGYGSLLPGFEGPYWCPKCHRPGIESAAMRHLSPSSRHYLRLPRRAERHCPTCTCGGGESEEQR
jgi:hypothetical protein